MLSRSEIVDLLSGQQTDVTLEEPIDPESGQIININSWPVEARTENRTQTWYQTLSVRQ